MDQRIYRIGQIVPSSNTTMETEIPSMLNSRMSIRPERFAFHSSRMRSRSGGLTRSGPRCYFIQNFGCFGTRSSTWID